MTAFEVYEAAQQADAGEFQTALDLLEMVSNFDRDARWFFEYSRACAGLERYYEAASSAKQAVELEPDNTAYRKQWKSYRKYRRKEKREETTGDCCAECCCECACEACCEGLCGGCG